MTESESKTLCDRCEEQPIDNSIVDNFMELCPTCLEEHYLENEIEFLLQTPMHDDDIDTLFDPEWINNLIKLCKLLSGKVNEKTLNAIVAALENPDGGTPVELCFNFDLYERERARMRKKIIAEDQEDRNKAKASNH